jgi:hypothetical protein
VLAWCYFMVRSVNGHVHRVEVADNLLTHSHASIAGKVEVAGPIGWKSPTIAHRLKQEKLQFRSDKEFKP